VLMTCEVGPVLIRRRGRVLRKMAVAVTEETCTIATNQSLKALEHPDLHRCAGEDVLSNCSGPFPGVDFDPPHVNSRGQDSPTALLARTKMPLSEDQGVQRILCFVASIVGNNFGYSVGCWKLLLEENTVGRVEMTVDGAES
jgi:hypothetical protein